MTFHRCRETSAELREAIAAVAKGDAKKVKITLRLRQETTMTLAWIAQQLEMGTKSHLPHLLYWQIQKG